MGMAGRFGPIGREGSFPDHILANGRSAEPAAPRNWWGVPSTSWYRQAGWSEQSFRGYYLDSLDFRVDQFRIPPKELAEILPQQSLMLDVAARALRDANWRSSLASRTGVLMGIGLDLNTTNYHWRWSVPDLARAWSEALGLDLDADELARWIDSLRGEASRRSQPIARSVRSEAWSPAGSCANFRLGDRAFPFRAMKTRAFRPWQSPLTGSSATSSTRPWWCAVDIAGDMRAVLARAQLENDERAAAASEGTGPNETATGPVACDGAVCLILKRLDDARRDGDLVLAVIRDVTMRSNPTPMSSSRRHSAKNEALPMDQSSDRSAEQPIGYLDVQTLNGALPAKEMLRALVNSSGDDREGRCAVGSVLCDLGNVGAATGLAAVAKAAVCLEQQVIPELRIVAKVARAGRGHAVIIHSQRAAILAEKLRRGAAPGGRSRRQSGRRRWRGRTRRV